MTTKNDFERLAQLAAMPSDQLERETKRAAVFLHGRVQAHGLPGHDVQSMRDQRRTRTRGSQAHGVGQ